MVRRISQDMIGDLGVFEGGIIPDNADIKDALVSVETSLNDKPSSSQTEITGHFITPSYSKTASKRYA